TTGSRPVHHARHVVDAQLARAGRRAPRRLAHALHRQILLGAQPDQHDALGARASLGIEDDHLIAPAGEISLRETGGDDAARGSVDGSRRARGTLGALEDAEDDGASRDALDWVVAELELHGSGASGNRATRRSRKGRVGPSTREEI